MLKNKKGTIEDKLYFLYVIIFVMVLLGTVYLAYGPIYDAMVNLGTAPATAMANIPPASVYGWADVLAAIFYFGLNIVICIILPMYVRHNPIYIVALFLFSFIYAYVSAIAMNALYSFWLEAGTVYVINTFIISNFVWLEAVFILLMAVIMFYKYRAVGEEMYYG